jgi:hypothetical protein
LEVLWGFEREAVGAWGKVKRFNTENTENTEKSGEHREKQIPRANFALGMTSFIFVVWGLKLRAAGNLDLMFISSGSTGDCHL